MNTQITDEQVKAWLHEQRNAAGIPSLVLWISTDKDCTACVSDKRLGPPYYGFGSTLSKAIESLRRQMPDPRRRANQLRQDAANTLAEAEALEAIVPAAVIADGEGRGV